MQGTTIQNKMSTSKFEKPGCIATGNGDFDFDDHIKTDLRDSDFRIITWFWTY